MITIEQALLQGLVIRPSGERTPEEIPREFQILASIEGGGAYQVLDSRSCYNGAKEFGYFVECNNVKNMADIEDHGTT